MVEKVTYIHLTTVDSTNNYVKNHYLDFDLTKMTRITADEQTKGRGRFNRQWVSPREENIYVTYFFRIDKNIPYIGNISQILALSITKVLHKIGFVAEIKWPNDILVRDKKIAGILCETIDLDETFGVILGAGINVNMSKKTLDQIDRVATSLVIELGKKQQVSTVIEMVEESFLKDYFLLQQNGFYPFHATYEALLKGRGKFITCKQNDHLISGILHSLHPSGQINVLLTNGKIETVCSGEIAH